jgi:hypothetical protein
VRANTLATRTDGNVEFHNQTLIEAVEFLGPDKGFRVTARCAGKTRAWEVERVVGNVGYSPDTQLYRELRIEESWSAGPRTSEPSFFILGSKSFGRNSHFLLGTGFQQVGHVFTLIMGKADLDLHKLAG